MPMNRLIAPLAALLLTSGSALAQHHQTPPAQVPYSGLETRPIKALSSEQIADLKGGRGMGLALPAELNGYPGPIHALEHAEALGLSAEQRTGVQRLYEAMKGEAVPLGEQLIDQEADLDRQFADRTVTRASLDRTTASIGRTQAALRAAHLSYHLAMMDVLTPAQARRYSELRGYATGGQPHHRQAPHDRH
jgi:Spy/CpxP family protein refolding chaperone